MGPPIWAILSLLEARIVSTLLESPAFHRGVRKVHRRVHEMRHGKIETPPEDVGGAYQERPKPARGGFKRFAELFLEELQSGSKPRGK